MARSFWGPVKPIYAEDTLAEHHRLRKSLSWPHLLALGVGAIVGTGIYTLTGVGADRAGPALPAPTPISVRMPVPTIAPTPSATRCGQPSDCLSRCSSGISSRATTALRKFQLLICCDPSVIPVM